MDEKTSPVKPEVPQLPDLASFEKPDVSCAQALALLLARAYIRKDKKEIKELYLMGADPFEATTLLPSRVKGGSQRRQRREHEEMSVANFCAFWGLKDEILELIHEVGEEPEMEGQEALIDSAIDGNQDGLALALFEKGARVWKEEAQGGRWDAISAAGLRGANGPMKVFLEKALEGDERFAWALRLLRKKERSSNPDELNGGEHPFLRILDNRWGDQRESMSEENFNNLSKIFVLACVQEPDRALALRCARLGLRKLEPFIRDKSKQGKTGFGRTGAVPMSSFQKTLGMLCAHGLLETQEIKETMKELDSGEFFAGVEEAMLAKVASSGQAQSAQTQRI